jgi:TRAP-type C4-dicarboxylate transport system permease small subunit
MESTKPGGIEAALRKICLIGNYVAGVILAFLVIVLVADVFGRFIDHPVLGSYEIVQYGFGLIVCLSVAHASMASGHIIIDLLFGAFPKGVQRVLIVFSEILSIPMFALIVWRLCSDGVQSYRISERSTTLSIPVSFFVFALAVGFALLTFVLILQFIKTIGGRE